MKVLLLHRMAIGQLKEKNIQELGKRSWHILLAKTWICCFYEFLLTNLSHRRDGYIFEREKIICFLEMNLTSI